MTSQTCHLTSRNRCRTPAHLTCFFKTKLRSKDYSCTVYKYTQFSRAMGYRVGSGNRIPDWTLLPLPNPMYTYPRVYNSAICRVCEHCAERQRHGSRHGHARGTAKGAHTQRQRHSCVSDGANMKKRHPPMSMSLSDTETESPTSLQSVSVRFVERAVLIMWALCRCGVNSAPRRRVDEVGALPHWLGAVKHVAS